jgi:single-stranded-DNA-specific exonuclease
MSPGGRADEVRETFRRALEGFHPGKPILLVGHNDADGLSAVAILAQAFTRSKQAVQIRIVGRGESPWSSAFAAEFEDQALGGAIVTDLGLRDGPLLSDLPTLVIDHHVPRGAPQVEAITGFGMSPIPTSSLLAWWCASALSQVEDLLWLAALGIIGDMADGAGFPEMAEARRRFGSTALKNAVTLINAGRRAPAGDAEPALKLLMKARTPSEVTSGVHPETGLLQAAKQEVAEALSTAKRTPPKVRNGVALIAFSSPCQVHPLVAQAWRTRLKNEVVVAANTGFRPGWVHFAVRAARDVDLIAWLADRAPPGADENYGSGHRQATGGALRPDDWAAFLRNIGFDPTEVEAA